MISSNTPAMALEVRKVALEAKGTLVPQFKLVDKRTKTMGIFLTVILYLLSVTPNATAIIAIRLVILSLFATHSTANFALFRQPMQQLMDLILCLKNLLYHLLISLVMLSYHVHI